MKVTFYGKPQPKERPRVIKGHAYTPTKTAQYEARLAAEWRKHYPEPTAEDVAVRIAFYLPTPQSWSKKKKELAERQITRPAVRPDIDNLAKIVLDGLNGVAYQDDKQVLELHAVKFYSAEPRTEIVITEL